MKKLGLFLITLLLITITSCSLDGDDTIPFHIEFVTVDTVMAPASVSPGHVYEFTVLYNKPNDCHYFDGFYYEADGSVRIVAPQTIVIEDAECQSLEGEEPETATFDFECKPGYEYDHYLFKFYKGEDAAGNQLYLEVTVPVVE